MAVCAVWCEPVSENISLLNGKIQEIYTIFTISLRTYLRYLLVYKLLFFENHFIRFK